MRTLSGKAVAGISLLAAALFVYGCSDNSSPSGTVEEEAEFRALTSPENLIYNLVLSYQELNITEYSKLLLNSTDGYGHEYIFILQPGDVLPGEEWLGRATDITRTNNMFLAAKGTPAKPEHPMIDELSLDIDPAVWSAIDSLWGEPCSDCWTTSRDYEIKIKVGEDEIRGIGEVDFYIVPVQVGDVTEYRIAFAIDVAI
jgi:hypothetical protein